MLQSGIQGTESPNRAGTHTESPVPVWLSRVEYQESQIGTEGQNIQELECGPMPNVMATLPNIGGALCSTPQGLADAHYQSAVQ